MVRMIIDRPFNLLLGGGRKVAFKAGEQDVADDLADHWYVKANGRIAPESTASKRKKSAREQDGQEAPPASSTDPDPGASSDTTGQDAGTDGEPAAGTEEDGEGGDNPDADTDDRAALVVEATALGINVDGRWGVDRIKTAIAEAKKG